MNRTSTSRRVVSACNQLQNFFNHPNPNSDLAQLLPNKIYKQIVAKSYLTCLTVLNLKELQPSDDFEQDYKIMKEAIETQLVEKPETLDYSQKKIWNFIPNSTVFGSETKQGPNQCSAGINVQELLKDEQLLQMLNSLIFTRKIYKSEQVRTNLMFQN